MVDVYIGLGSNLSGTVESTIKQPRAQLECALSAISQHSEIKLIKVSSFYQTPAIGPGEQADYVNAAARLETRLCAYELLDFLQSIENHHGRVRTERWGARTLDLDILLYGNHIEHTARLTLPHPRLHERAFVLMPLADIDPLLAVVNKQNVTQLLANCSTQGIVKLEDS
jgi:2-amino-4-hydroxy-6-hydroxymethyldihydropteridine diphosphokinase